MSKSTEQAASGGISAGGLLGVAFVVLKLCHVIDWSWWWVTAPFWGPLAFVLAILIVVAFFSFVTWAIMSISERRSRNRRMREFLERTP